MYKNHSSNCVSLKYFVLKVLKVLGLYKAIDTVTSSMKYKGGQSWSTRYWLEIIRWGGGRYIVCLNKNWDGRQCLTHTSGVPILDYN